MSSLQWAALNLYNSHEFFIFYNFDNYRKSHFLLLWKFTHLSSRLTCSCYKLSEKCWRRLIRPMKGALMNELKNAILFLQRWSGRNNRGEIRALRLDCKVQRGTLLCLRRGKENHILIINGKWCGGIVCCAWRRQRRRLTGFYSRWEEWEAMERPETGSIKSQANSSVVKL